MTVPPAVLDYFALEAADCLDRLEGWLTAAAGGPPPPAGEAAQAARALRGAATVARQPEFAALAQAAERALTVPAGGAVSADARDALAEAVDVARSLLRAPRPFAPADAERLAAHARTLDACAGAAPDAGSGLAQRVVPVRTLAHDGDTAFVVYRAPHPPATADARFREASLPLAEALRRLVADAHAAAAENGSAGPAGDAATHTLGADVRAAVADLRELAESYDVAPAATFFRGREAGAGALEPRALAAVDAAAAGLLAGRPIDAPPRAVGAGPQASGAPNEPGDGPPDAAPGPTPDLPVAPVAVVEAPAVVVDAPARPDAFRPPTGEALVALLETGISGLAQLRDVPDPASPADATPSEPGVVPIESLLYRGRAALDRARAVRDELRAAPGAPDPAKLAELYDLLDLAAQG